jgi:hypothetical protein
VGEQGVGVRGVSALEHDGSCSEGSGSFSGQVRPLRNTKFNLLLDYKIQLYLSITCLETVLWNSLTDQRVWSPEYAKYLSIEGQKFEDARICFTGCWVSYGWEVLRYMKGALMQVYLGATCRSCRRVCS